MTTWVEVAVVVRSHDRTWIGHVAGATYDDTPAGPLRVVKDAVVVMAREEWKDDETRTRWRHLGDVWILDRDEDPDA